MKKLLSALAITASFIQASPASAFGPEMTWRSDVLLCKDAPKTQARCYSGKGPSSPQLYNQIKSQAQSNPTVSYMYGFAAFSPRDSAPSDSYMRQEAQFSVTDITGENKFYFTEQGDAYVCPSYSDGCYYESAFSLNQVFERVARGNALKFKRLEQFQGNCVLVDYVVTKTYTVKNVIAFAYPGVVCTY